MKTKISVAMLLIMISMNLTASILGKLAKGGKVHSISNFVQSCSGGDMEACYELGVNYEYANNGVAIDYSLSEKHYKKSCSGGYYRACSNLAKLYDFLSVKPVESARLYKLACDNGITDSCYATGLIYMSGRVVKKDLNKAITYLKKRLIADKKDCEGEDKESTICIVIDECKQLLLNKNKGHPYFDKAFSLYLSECDKEMNHKSCSSLSNIYHRGFGGNKDLPLSKIYKSKASSILTKSCEEGNMNSCISLFYEYFFAKDMENIMLYANKLQKAGRGEVYEYLGDMYSGENGEEVDKVKAKEQYLKASKIYKIKCSKGDSKSCATLAYFYSFGLGVRQNEKKKNTYDELACTFGDPYSCSSVGKYEEAAVAKAKKCEEGDNRICEKLHPVRTKALYKKKCDENDGKSCYEYACMIKESF